MMENFTPHFWFVVLPDVLTLVEFVVKKHNFMAPVKLLGAGRLLFTVNLGQKQSWYFWLCLFHKFKANGVIFTVFTVLEISPLVLKDEKCRSVRSLLIFNKYTQFAQRKSV